MAPRSSDLKRLAFDAKAAAYVRRTGRTPMGDAIWTQREISVCLEHHPDFVIMQKKLPRRTRGAIAEMCRRLGLTDPPKPWTGAEHIRLRKMYPSASWEEILAAFPGRTRQGIIQVAYRRGLRRDRRPYKIIGHLALDQVRQRCFELGLNMPDLDEWVNGKGFFSRLALRGRRPHMHTLERAAKALGGKLVVEWPKEPE